MNNASIALKFWRLVEEAWEKSKKNFSEFELFLPELQRLKVKFVRFYRSGLCWLTLFDWLSYHFLSALHIVWASSMFESVQEFEFFVVRRFWNRLVRWAVFRLPSLSRLILVYLAIYLYVASYGLFFYRTFCCRPATTRNYLLPPNVLFAIFLCLEKCRGPDKYTKVFANKSIHRMKFLKGRMPSCFFFFLSVGIYFILLGIVIFYLQSNSICFRYQRSAIARTSRVYIYGYTYVRSSAFSSSAPRLLIFRFRFFVSVKYHLVEYTESWCRVKGCKVVHLKVNTLIIRQKSFLYRV